MLLSQFLERTGMNSYEKEVVGFLSTIETADAHTVYKNTSVPKGRIYSVLNGLKETGIVQVIPTSPKKYCIPDLKAGLSLYLGKKKNRIEEEITEIGNIELTPKRFSNVNEPSVRMFTGRDEHLDAITFLNEKAEKEILQIAPLFRESFATRLSRMKALKKGIGVRIIVGRINETNKKNIAESMLNGAEVRTLNSTELISLVVCDKKEFLLGVQDYKKGEERVTLLSRNKEVCLIMEKTFYKMWEKAKRIQRL